MTERRDRIADLAIQARRGIESLLDALGWPADEIAFHRAIDRLIQLEEDDRASR